MTTLIDLPDEEHEGNQTPPQLARATDSLSPEVLAAMATPATLFSGLGIHSWAGDTEKITTVISYNTFNRIKKEEDLLKGGPYDPDSKEPGGRAIVKAHAKDILESIKASLTDTKRLFVGTITLAVDPDHIHVTRLAAFGDNEHASLCRFGLLSHCRAYKLDGNHRCEVCDKLQAFAYLVGKANKDDSDEKKEMRRLMEKTSIDVVILLEGDRDVLGTIYVEMANTKPAPKHTETAMDKRYITNRIADYVTQRSDLLRHRVAYHPNAEMKKIDEHFNNMYDMASLRSGLAALLGTGVKDRNAQMRAKREKAIEELAEAEALKLGRPGDVKAGEQVLGDECVRLLDYAYGVMPGWKDVKLGRISVDTFKRDYIHGAAAGFTVFANAVCAARLAGVNERAVIDELAKLPWRRDAFDPDIKKDEFGQPFRTHEFFLELVHVKLAGDGTWVPASAGATRSAYMPAIKRVLRRVAQVPGLEDVNKLSVLQEMGLESGGPTNKGGRPRKTA